MSPSRARAGEGGKHWGRITVYCLSEAFEREALEAQLQKIHPDVTALMYPDVRICFEVKIMWSIKKKELYIK